MWVAIALSLLGLILLAQVWNGLSFDLIGLLGALFSAFALTALRPDFDRSKGEAVQLHNYSWKGVAHSQGMDYPR
jgi:hypothetical protein